MDPKNRETINRWQTVLRRYFPGVVVGWNRGVPGENIEFLDVFMVPDELMGTFGTFFIEEQHKLVKSENLPDMDMLSYSVTSTREHFPEVWRLAQSESSAIAKTAPRKMRSKPRRRAPAAKKAVSAR